MNRHLSRGDDPETSAMAAASLDMSLSDKHERVMSALVSICPATDLEMAQALSQLGYGREESCRRMVRTLREEHGRLVAAIDIDTGDQIRHLNPTGRWAECWIPGRADPTDRDSRDTVLARVARCREVMVDGVEHVRFDGDDYYMAAGLLDALTLFDESAPEPPPEPEDDGPTGQLGMW